MPGIRKNYIPLLDEVDVGETVFTHHAINFSSYNSSYTQRGNIYYLPINNDSSPVSTLEEYTIDSQHTAGKEEEE